VKLTPERLVRACYARGWSRLPALLYPLLIAAQPLARFSGPDAATRLADLLLLVSDAFFMSDRRAPAAGAVRRARRLYEAALANSESHVAATKGLALINFYQEDYAAAETLLRRIAERGEADAETLTYLGRLRAERDDFLPAREYFLQAIEKKRDYSLVYTAYGNIRPFLADFKGKWQRYDDADRSVPHHPQAKLWRGESLAGRSIAVFPVSGIGDEVRYACTYDRLIAMATRCIIFCEPRLEALFRRSFPEAEVRPLFRKHTYNVNQASLRNPQLEAVPSDYYTINLNAIQFLFDSADQCETRRYLQVDTGQAERWGAYFRARAAGRPVVGIDWRSGLMLFKRRREYMDLAEWRPILETQDVLFVSLSYSGDEEMRAFAATSSAEILRPPIDLRDDFDGLAALVSALDLVISAPTNIAELAGIVGTPTWLVESSPGYHYRWRIKRDGSDIWFPNLRHFNRVLAGGREINIANVARELSLHFRATAAGAQRARSGPRQPSLAAKA
jgi:hypothetical protein